MQASGGRLRIPLVVAPRFIPGTPVGKQGGGWSPDTDLVPDASRITPTVATEVGYTASVEIDLAPGFPAKVESPTHGELLAPFNLPEGGSRTIRLERLRPDRDVILTYATVAVLPTVRADRTSFRSPTGGVEEFLLLQFTPGAGQEPTTPLDVVLCLDRSGSMAGPKIEGLRVVARKVLDRLAGTHRPVHVGIVAFNDRPTVLVPLSLIGEQHRTAIGNVQDDGGTQLGAALDAALGLLRGERDQHERCVIVVSDGQTESLQCSRHGDVRIHGVGLDAAVNDASLREIAEQTGGATEWITPGEDYDGAAGRIAALASGPVVDHVEVRGLPDGAEVVGVGPLYAGRPRTIAVRLPQPIAGCTVVGSGADGKPVEWPIAVPAQPTTDLGARLWAKARIRETEDRDERTTLSLRYGIIGPTTAFVAVSMKAQPGQQPERVDIPVLLPHTWEFDAVRAGASLASGGFAAAACAVMVGEVSDASYGLGPPAAAAASPSRRVGAMRRFVGSVRRIATRSASPVPPQPPDVVPATPAPRDLIVRAKALLELLGAASHDRTVADDQWRQLERLLTEEARQGFVDWSEQDQAELYMLLLQLRDYGYSTAIPEVIRQEPKNPDARRIWQRARRHAGVAAI